MFICEIVATMTLCHLFKQMITSITILALHASHRPVDASRVREVFEQLLDSFAVDCGVMTPSLVITGEKVTAPFISPLCPGEAVSDEFS